MAGAVTTQGDRAIRAKLARRWFGLDGSGITIGIISDSFNALGSAGEDVRTGDLPGAGNPEGYRQPVRVLRDLQSGSDEGRALAQIIFDVAPGATLLFHTTGNDEQGFAQAVRALAAAGADIIVDDILLATSTFFQDGMAAQAVNEVVAQGITYVTAAGNNSDRSYQSTFRSGNTFTFRGNTYTAHDFDAGTGEDLFQDISIPAGAELDLVLNWEQASGNVETEVDLFLLDSPQFPGADAQVLAEGILMSEREEDPSKRIAYDPATNASIYLLIASRSNTSAPTPDPGLLKWISFSNASDRGTTYQYVNDPASDGSSTIYGHQNAAGAITVGAVAAQQTPAFGVATPILEDFSSVGSAPILFDGQGNRLLVPENRQKPELVAPDRVDTTVAGFGSFIGTSASAPHVAATVALMLQRAGGRGRLTPTQLLAAMQQTALPVTNSEAGLLQANAAVLQAFKTEWMGTPGNDALRGQKSADNLSGLGGNDTLKGAGGFDALWGDTGNDQLLGDRGNDYLLGQGDHDRLLGGEGQDWLNGGTGTDFLKGGQGNDMLRGGAGRDTLMGGRGRNTLMGGKGADRFNLDRLGLASIQDFQNGIDRLGLFGTLEFEQLTIERAGRDVLIKQLDRTLAVLDNVPVSRISRADFVAI